MKGASSIAALCLAAASLFQPVAAATNQYRVAHVKHQNSNMVIVIVNPRFFHASNQQQAKWFTAVQQCVRSVKLAGQTLVVTNDNGRFRYYGPNNWHNFLSTIDMNWVNSRVNKELTCNF